MHECDPGGRAPLSALHRAPRAVRCNIDRAATAPHTIAGGFPAGTVAAATDELHASRVRSGDFRFARRKHVSPDARPVLSRLVRNDTVGPASLHARLAANAGVNGVHERSARLGRTSGSSRRSVGIVRLAKVLNKLKKAHVGTRDRSKFAHQAVSLTRIREFLALLDRSHAHHHHHRVAIGAFVKLGRHETSAADDYVSHSVGDPSG